MMEMWRIWKKRKGRLRGLAARDVAGRAGQNIAKVGGRLYSKESEESKTILSQKENNNSQYHSRESSLLAGEARLSVFFTL